MHVTAPNLNVNYFIVTIMSVLTVTWTGLRSPELTQAYTAQFGTMPNEKTGRSFGQRIRNQQKAGAG